MPENELIFLDIMLYIYLHMCSSIMTNQLYDDLIQIYFFQNKKKTCAGSTQVLKMAHSYFLFFIIKLQTKINSFCMVSVFLYLLAFLLQENYFLNFVCDDIYLISLKYFYAI